LDAAPSRIQPLATLVSNVGNNFIVVLLETAKEFVIPGRRKPLEQFDPRTKAASNRDACYERISHYLLRPGSQLMERP
jgi:hypothetical protein